MNQLHRELDEIRQMVESRFLAAKTDKSRVKFVLRDTKDNGGLVDIFLQSLLERKICKLYSALVSPSHNYCLCKYWQLTCNNSIIRRRRDYRALRNWGPPVYLHYVTLHLNIPAMLQHRTAPAVTLYLIFLGKELPRDLIRHQLNGHFRELTTRKRGKSSSHTTYMRIKARKPKYNK